MITQLTVFTLNLLRSNVGLVLAFYASGFLSFIAYYRVLGISYVEGDLQTYAELAGKNIIFILQTFIMLLTKPSHLLAIFDNISWTGSAIYIWMLTVCLLLISYGIFKFVVHSIITRIRQNTYTIKAQFLFIIVMMISAFYIEIQPFKSDNVLQVNNLAEFYQEKQNLLNYEQQTKKIDYSRRAKKFAEFNSDNFFFATQKGKDTDGKDALRANALMLIIIVVSLSATVLALYRQHYLIKWLIFFFALVQAIFIPFDYGILGEQYQYPVITLDYSAKDKILHKEGVFLLAKSQHNLVIYDRLNFFTISYIPQSTVISIEQVFSSSPFSNCSTGDFKPCELYAIKPLSD